MEEIKNNIELTEQQKGEIFALAKKEIDKEIKQNGFYDDNLASDLEDIMINSTEKVLGTDTFKQYCNIFDTTDYAKIIDLAMNFIFWLFDTKQYDEKYYDETFLIKKKNKRGKQQC